MFAGNKKRGTLLQEGWLHVIATQHGYGVRQPGHRHSRSRIHRVHCICQFPPFPAIDPRIETSLHCYPPTRIPTSRYLVRNKRSGSVYLSKPSAFIAYNKSSPLIVLRFSCLHLSLALITLKRTTIELLARDECDKLGNALLHALLRVLRHLRRWRDRPLHDPADVRDREIPVLLVHFHSDAAGSSVFLQKRVRELGCAAMFQEVELCSKHGNEWIRTANVLMSSFAPRACEGVYSHQRIRTRNKARS